MKKIDLIFILNILFVFALQAQDSFPSVTDNMALKGTAANDRILLRWAPANVSAWLDGKKYGYVLERFTAYKNGVFQEVPEKKLIGEKFLPRPLQEWETQAVTSDYTAVIAQALYGDDFSVYIPGNSIESIVNQSAEIEQRFAVSVFSAEYDFQGAVLAGWGYADTDVKPDEQYLYRIHINRPVPEKGDTALALIGLADKKTLPKPVDLFAVFGDLSVVLSWNYSLYSDIYHSFHVERASDTDTTLFQQITDIPVTVMEATAQEIFFLDSLPDNTHIYRYRVRGITSFGETGAYSDVIYGQGVKKIPCLLDIMSGDFTGPNRAEIHWEYECEDLSHITKMEIKQSSEVDGEYTVVFGPIYPPQRSVQLKLKDPINYLKINAYLKDGSQTESFPYMIRQADSIPPAVPVDLKAYIDTLGVAHLSWKANEELDLRGYRILRSFLEQEEKSSITPRLIDIAEFTDTLALDNLNSAVYYAVSALDMNYNESEPSPTLKVEKPNLSAPNEPVITSFSQEGNRIRLSWITNPRDTTIVYELIRIPQNGTEEVVCKGNYQTASYTDQVPNGTYRYTVAATARNGKRAFSPQQPAFTVAVLKKLEPISGFRFYTGEKNDYIELMWKKQPQAEMYYLYKKTSDEPMVLIRELAAEETKFVDEVVTPTANYTYVIIYSISTGQKSQPASLTIHF